MSVNSVCLPYPFSRFPHQDVGFASSVSQTIDREKDGPIDYRHRIDLKALVNDRSHRNDTKHA